MQHFFLGSKWIGKGILMAVSMAASMVMLFACGNKPAATANDAATAAAADGMQKPKNYMLLKRFRVVDNTGFNQPVEVSSFLLPADWQMTGGIKWYPMNKCIPEMVQGTIQARSADNKFEILLFPVTQFDWSDDPVYLDAMRRGFNMHSCNIAPPLDANGYIIKSIAPNLNAQVKKSGSVPPLQTLMDQGAARMTQTARQAGNYAYTHRGSAAEGILQFKDGKEGIALCTLMQTIVSIPGTQGGMSATYQSYVSLRVVIKYEAGEEAMARRIFSTFLSSTRMNPIWTNAVQVLFRNIGKSAQIELGKQIEITRQAQEEISNNIVRNWERNANSSNSDQTQQQFSQYLRGVDSWTDEGGSKIELTNGYTNAWSKGDGTYLLTNDPSVDPNVEFKENWKRLNR